MKLFLPSKLNLAQVVRRYPLTRIPNFSIDKLAYFLHLISEVPAKNKHLELKKGFVPLSAKLMQRIERNYRKYLDYAVRAGILLEDNHYIVCKKSKGFKFASKYVSKLTEYLTGDPRLERNLMRQDANRIKIPRPLQYLANSFTNGKLTFDHEAALNFINLQDQYFENHPDKIPRNMKTGKHKNPVAIYNSGLFCIERLKAQEFYMSVDETVNRLHTNLTNMPSSLRNFLTYDGKGLASVDIANCQPYLANATLNSDFYLPERIFRVNKRKKLNKNLSRDTKSEFIQLEGDKVNIYKINKKIITKIKQTNINLISLLILVKTNETITSKGFEVYKKLCSNGELYEFMQGKFYEKLGLEYEGREFVKVAMFQVLFTDNRFINTLEAQPKKVFKELFPAVYEVFFQLKKGNSTILPCLLQSLESWLILHVICKRIHRERPHLPLFTIHDSIVTTEENQSYVRKVMKEELTRHIGLPPTLKTEIWNPKVLHSLFRD